MTRETQQRADQDGSRVLVLSMSLAPCREVGGMRFSFLSRYLSESCAEYHVLARREKTPIDDTEAFDRNVHRVAMFPYFSTGRTNALGRVLKPVWKNWLCLVDPYIGWVIPAIVAGLRLNRKHHFNVVIVTVPSFSALIAATIISKTTGCRLIIDYRDPWTNHRSVFPKPFGKWLCPAIERTSIKQAHAIVFCSEIMLEQFIEAFGSLAPPRLEVIYNGFSEFDAASNGPASNSSVTNMLYAGRLYGVRRLSLIAPAIAELSAKKVISPGTFQFHVYAPLDGEDKSTIKRYRIGDFVQVHKHVHYVRIKHIMSKSDILFLPSGDDVSYAVPFKFFDYLSVRRPILAVAAKGSTVHRLMQAVDCGEFAEFGDSASVLGALTTLFERKTPYTFAGAEQFRWENAAASYSRIIDHAAQSVST